MKQNISVKQLQELTDDQKERLRDWWKPQKGDWFVACGDIEIAGSFICGTIDSYNQAGWCYEKKDCLPLLSIGQCIELLGAKDPGSWSICCSKSGGWYITSSNLYAPKYYIADGGKDFEEIIDALWEAVKAVL